MNRTIEEVTNLLMYQGPTIEELLKEVATIGAKFSVDKKIEATLITVKSNLPYQVVIEDKYIYDNEGRLIKQTLLLNGKEKCVFDKFKEAQKILDACNLKLSNMVG